MTHPSTFEQECRELRARVMQLEATLMLIRDSKKWNHLHMRRAAAVALQNAQFAVHKQEGGE